MRRGQGTGKGEAVPLRAMIFEVEGEGSVYKSGKRGNECALLVVDKRQTCVS